MKKLIFILLPFLFSEACTNPRYLGELSMGFVSEYTFPEEIISYPYATENIIEIWIVGKRYRGGSNPGDEYRTLAEKYGDTSYNRYKSEPGLNGALAVEPNGISIICDKDVDAEHPAGTPLDDIILMHGWTFLEYIKSGYTYYTNIVPEDYGYGFWPYGITGNTPFFKYLKDIARSDMILMRNDFYLYLPQDWPAGDYNLTITMLFDDFELSETVLYSVK